MSIIRWTPVRNVSAYGHDGNFTAVQREMDRVFNHLFKGGSQGGSVDDGAVSTYLPPVDIIERDNEFVVKAELPGVSKEDVKITVTDDVLTIRGEKKEEKEKNEKDYHRIERSSGSFLRSFTLPGSVKSEGIEASYENGILTITLPKVEEAKPKHIEVKVK